MWNYQFLLTFQPSSYRKKIDNIGLLTDNKSSLFQQLDIISFSNPHKRLIEFFLYEFKKSPNLTN